MKLSRLIALLLVPAALLLSVESAEAQSIAPDGQFGIHAATNGFGLQYALSPALQIGAQLGFLTGDLPGGAESSYSFGPYVRFLLEGEVNPYFEGMLALSGVTPEEGDAITSTTVSLGFGLAYYITQNVGVYGGIHLLELGLDDPSTTVFGISPSGHVGIEMYMD